MSDDITELTTNISNLAKAQPAEKERFPCREPGCTRMFIYRKARDNHEANVHSLDSSTSSVTEPTSLTVSVDYKKEHTEARLSFGFLLLNFLDAVKEGDGERLMRLYKVALLIFKTYGHSQYAYSTLLLTVQTNATLSPRLAHSLTWNRFWNGRGGKGRNIPLDLHLEHLNNFLKTFLKNKGPNLTEDAADRVSRSVGVLKTVMDTTDKELQVYRPSGIHNPADMERDILTLLDVFNRAELFQHQPGRHFSAFPDFERNIISKLNFKDLWQWMRSKLKEFRALPL